MRKMSERDRRDWSLLVFIVPLGILLMLIAGQFAMRIIPQWILNTGMGSSLEVETAGGQMAIIQPLFNIQILTPYSWQNTYLTPNADSGFSFPPFVVLEPSATPSKTLMTNTPVPTESTPTPLATTVTPSSAATVVVTTPPPTTSTDPAPKTCQEPGAINIGQPLPCEFPPPPTCQEPGAINIGQPLPCEFPPPPTCEEPFATNYGGSLPCVYPPTATPEFVSGTQDVPPIGIIGTDIPDDNIGSISDGHYVVLNFSGNPIVVFAVPDDNYDLVFYEDEVGASGRIQLDQIIIGLTNDITLGYYEVFNWGDNDPDTNTNADINNLPPDLAPGCIEPECDNYQIETTDLYPTPSGTGILIDVDTAPAPPPPDSYNFVVLISPIVAGSSGNNAQVDAVVVTEVPIPTPTP